MKQISIAILKNKINKLIDSGAIRVTHLSIGSRINQANYIRMLERFLDRNFLINFVNVFLKIQIVLFD